VAARTGRGCRSGGWLLTDHLAVVELIGATATNGLRVESAAVTRAYTERDQGRQS
jgi:hypothetical protein